MAGKFWIRKKNVVRITRAGFCQKRRDGCVNLSESNLVKTSKYAPKACTRQSKHSLSWRCIDSALTAVRSFPAFSMFAYFLQPLTLFGVFSFFCFWRSFLFSRFLHVTMTLCFSIQYFWYIIQTTLSWKTRYAQLQFCANTWLLSYRVKLIILRSL